MEENNLRKGAFAVAVLITSPQGMPLVLDPKKPHAWWKIAGGNSEEGEIAEETAVREINEELGLILKREDLKLAFEEQRPGHIFKLFTASVESLDGLKSIGNEMEKVKVFDLAEIKNMPDFMPNHRRILKALKII